MDTHYDALIVGSGFGGSVMAYRLVEAGLKVALLERGKLYAPGSFTRTPAGMRKNFWDPDAKLYGMFQPWSFRGMEVVTASGLGGGSLVYANALIRRDPETFGPEWPIKYKDLETSYAETEDWLGGTPYPFDKKPYNTTPKTMAMRDAAMAIGSKELPWRLPKLAVTFGNDPQNPRPGEPLREPAGEENMHGAFRRACTLCGECDLGCNDGAKNTLDLNYLSAAKRLGLEIRVHHEAKRVEPLPNGGYRLHVDDHTPVMEGRAEKPTSLSLTADKVILSAGTFGTTYLLLKSVRERMLKLGDALGTRYSGNGDILSFSFNVKDDQGNLRSVDPMRGPVLTSTFFGDRFIIQDGGFPPMVGWMIEMANFPSLLKRGAHLAGRVIANWMGWNKDTDLSAELSAAIGDAALTDSMMVFLGIGIDAADGKLTLEDRFLEMAWKPTRSREHFQRVLDAARKISDALHGEFVENPSYKLGRVITPHPLGGAPMAANPNDGVCDPSGEVFGYPGLYLADGSVMPGAIGPNPSLTIAAVSNHFADRMLTKLSTTRSIKPRRPRSTPEVRPTP